MRKLIGKMILFSGIFLCSISIAAHVVKAAPGPGDEEPDAGPEPSIISVFVDFTGSSIFINGEAFGTNPLVSPTVELATVPITVTSFTDTFIEAALPPGTADGDYLLTVETEVDNDTYNLTIGAVGPQREQGIVGAQGDPGSAGMQGVAGPEGSQGLPGFPGSANISGTTNSIVKFTGPTTGGNSVIIDNGINVGIGTTGPEGKLHVHTGSARVVTPNTVADELVVEGSGVGVGISILSPDTSEGFVVFGSPSHNWGGAIRHQFNTKLMQFQVGGAIRLQIQNNQIKAPNGIASVPAWTFINSTGTGFFLDQVNNIDLGMTTNGLERMRITSTGKVGIGTTSPAAKLHVIGSVICSAGCTSSSRSLKYDIRDLGLEEAMETLEELRLSRFVYKHNDEEEVGFIAEDVPELVAKKGRKGLDAMDIVAVLTKVVQHQQNEIAGLRTTVAGQEVLRAEVTALKAKMTQIINQVLADKPLKTEVTIAKTN